MLSFSAHSLSRRVCVSIFLLSASVSRSYVLPIKPEEFKDVSLWSEFEYLEAVEGLLTAKIGFRSWSCNIGTITDSRLELVS
eukprot:758185-Hanusia_phi.AAC.8